MSEPDGTEIPQNSSKIWVLREQLSKEGWSEYAPSIFNIIAPLLPLEFAMVPCQQTSDIEGRGTRPQSHLLDGKQRDKRVIETS